MLKHTLFILALLCSPLLRASALDDALASAEQLKAKIGASSSIKSPSVNNYQSVQGDASVLKGFAENLASQLSSLNIGPAAEVRSVSIDLGVRIGTLQGVNAIDVSAFINACRGVSDVMASLEGQLPGLIDALKAEKSRALVAVQTATQWTPPTPIPAPQGAGGLQPTPTPIPRWIPPTAVPTAVTHPGEAPQAPGVNNPGTIPGGPSLPPLPPVIQPPSAPASTPTPQAVLKAPVSLLILGKGMGGQGERGYGKVYIANVNAGTVAVMDTRLKRVVKQIPVESQPVAMAQGILVAVANFASGSVSLIDPKSDSLVATLEVGSHPVDVAADGEKAFVVNQASNSVSVIDLKMRRVGKVIKVGRQPSRIMLSHEEKRAYVSNTQDDSIAVIDTQIDELIATVNE